MTSNDQNTASDAPDVQGGAGHRYGDPRSGDTPVPSGAGPVAGDAADDLGGTAAGNPLEGLTGDDDLPAARASEQGTPAASKVTTTTSESGT